MQKIKFIMRNFLLHLLPESEIESRIIELTNCSRVQAQAMMSHNKMEPISFMLERDRARKFIDGMQLDQVQAHIFMKLILREPILPQERNYFSKESREVATPLPEKAPIKTQYTHVSTRALVASEWQDARQALQEVDQQLPRGNDEEIRKMIDRFMRQCEVKTNEITTAHLGLTVHVEKLNSWLIPYGYAIKCTHHQESFSFHTYVVRKVISKKKAKCP